MATARSTEPTSVDATAAMNAVIDALSEWRDEVETGTTRYNQLVLERIAKASETFGWPKELLDSSKAFMEQASQAQMQMIDQMIGVWQQQLKSPVPGQFFPQLRASPSFGELPFNPMQMWVQAAEAWQRSLAQTWSMWTPPRH